MLVFLVLFFYNFWFRCHWCRYSPKWRKRMQNERKITIIIMAECAKHHHRLHIFGVIRRTTSQDRRSILLNDDKHFDDDDNENTNFVDFFFHCTFAPFDCSCSLWMHVHLYILRRDFQLFCCYACYKLCHTYMRCATICHSVPQWIQMRNKLLKPNKKIFKNIIFKGHCDGNWIPWILSETLIETSWKHLWIIFFVHIGT